MTEPIALEPAQAAIVRSLTTDACQDMFQTLGSPVTLLEKLEGPAHDIAAFIGFTGSARGMLMIASSMELFRSSYPSKTGTPPSVVGLFDWAAEVANQLLGRIKRRFCERGLDFDVSMPTAVRGRELGGRAPARDGACNLAFTIGDQGICVSLEVAPPDNGRIFKDPAEPIGCAIEGDLVLF
jgi:CheY-specific phosphatase CheX